MRDCSQKTVRVLSSTRPPRDDVSIMRNGTPSAMSIPGAPAAKTRHKDISREFTHTHLVDCNLVGMFRFQPGQNLATLFCHRQSPWEFPCKGRRDRNKRCQEKAQGKTGVSCRNHPRLDSKLAPVWCSLLCSTSLHLHHHVSFIGLHGAPSLQ